MTGIELYSKTAASNNSTPPNGWPEGQAPSTVNDCARQMMAAIRTWYEDSEWIKWGDTTVYASGTSFTIAGTDATGRYAANRRIRAVGSSTGTIYGAISSSSFSTNTTVNITWDSGSLSNETLTISIAALNPTNTSVALGAGSVTTTALAAGAVTEAKMTLADNTTGNVSTSAHGFAPKAPNDATKFLDGTGAYSKPSASAAPAAITGCLITSIAGAHTTATATITSGVATDSTNAAYITCAGYSWAASNGNAINGTDAASSTLANSTTYHMFLCSGGSGTGTFCSASLTPTFPTGYTTYSRRIGSFNTNGSGAPLPYTSVEIGGGATINWLSTVVQDIAITNLISASRAAQTLASIPTGIKFKPEIIALSTTSGGAVWLSSPDAPDTAPASEASPSTSPGLFLSASSGFTSLYIPPNLTTNTSAQIYARGNSGTTTSLYITTQGWTDFRRN